jgi:ABC-type transporter Mla subunit MlaD
MKRLLIAAFAAMLVLSACSPSVEEATAAYCEDLQTLLDTLISQDIQPASAVDDVEAYVDGVEAAYDDVESSAEDLDQAVSTQLEAARSDFDDAVSSISGDATVGEAFQQFADARDGYAAAVGETLDSVNCQP